MLERVADLVNADASLVRRGRDFSTRFLVEVEADLRPLRANLRYVKDVTGEYDVSCTPADTERTAAKLKGARVTVMSENPAQFRRYLLPVLAVIRARG